MRDEMSNTRPSLLSAVFRKWAAPDGPLADWTRCVDGDWVWYCPECYQVVVLIEEKTERAKQRAWNVTRRMATRHEDRPWGWLVVCHDDGSYSVTGARGAGDGHESFGERTLTQDDLLAWITRTFEQHYTEHGHRRSA